MKTHTFKIALKTGQDVRDKSMVFEAFSWNIFLVRCLFVFFTLFYRPIVRALINFQTFSLLHTLNLRKLQPQFYHLALILSQESHSTALLPLAL